MGVRGCPRMPSESNFDHAAVSQEGGCQLNHLYGGVIHPWSVPTQQKINPEARTCQLPCHLPLGIQQRRSTAISTAFSWCIPVYSALSSSRAACRGLQLYSGIQRSTVSLQYTALQRYTVLYTAVYIPPQIDGDLLPKLDSVPRSFALICLSQSREGRQALQDR